MKRRIITAATIASLTVGGIAGITATPASAHVNCQTTTSTTIGGSNVYCYGTVSCEWVKERRKVHHWYGDRWVYTGKKIFKCW